MANPTGAIPGARAEEPVTPINNGETTSLITDLTGRLRVRIAATGANGIPIDIFSGENGGMQVEDSVAGDALNGVNATVIEALSVQQHGTYLFSGGVEDASAAVVIKETPGRLYRAMFVYVSGAGVAYLQLYARTNDDILTSATFPIAVAEIEGVAGRRIVYIDFGVFGVHFNPGLLAVVSTSPSSYVPGSPVIINVSVSLR